MTAEDQEKVRAAIQFLIELLKKRGVEDGCEPDYDGGSYASDLRFLAKFLEVDLSDMAEAWKVKLSFKDGLGDEKLISLLAESREGLAFLQIASLKLQAPIMETVPVSVVKEAR